MRDSGPALSNLGCDVFSGPVANTTKESVKTDEYQRPDKCQLRIQTMAEA